jgi:hypothetical protein
MTPKGEESFHESLTGLIKNGRQNSIRSKANTASGAPRRVSATSGLDTSLHLELEGRSRRRSSSVSRGGREGRHNSLSSFGHSSMGSSFGHASLSQLPTSTFVSSVLISPIKAAAAPPRSTLPRQGSLKRNFTYPAPIIFDDDYDKEGGEEKKDDDKQGMFVLPPKAKDTPNLSKGTKSSSKRRSSSGVSKPNNADSSRSSKPQEPKSGTRNLVVANKNNRSRRDLSKQVSIRRMNSSLRNFPYEKESLLVQSSGEKNSEEQEAKDRELQEFVKLLEDQHQQEKKEHKKERRRSRSLSREQKKERHRSRSLSRDARAGGRRSSRSKSRDRKLSSNSSRHHAPAPDGPPRFPANLKRSSTGSSHGARRGRTMDSQSYRTHTERRPSARNLMLADHSSSDLETKATRQSSKSKRSSSSKNNNNSSSRTLENSGGKLSSKSEKPLKSTRLGSDSNSDHLAKSEHAANRKRRSSRVGRLQQQLPGNPSRHRRRHRSRSRSRSSSVASRRSTSTSRHRRRHRSRSRSRSSSVASRRSTSTSTSNTGTSTSNSGTSTNNGSTPLSMPKRAPREFFPKPNTATTANQKAFNKSMSSTTTEGTSKSRTSTSTSTESISKSRKRSTSSSRHKRRNKAKEKEREKEMQSSLQALSLSIHISGHHPPQPRIYQDDITMDSNKAVKKKTENTKKFSMSKKEKEDLRNVFGDLPALKAFEDKRSGDEDVTSTADMTHTSLDDSLDSFGLVAFRVGLTSVVRSALGEKDNNQDQDEDSVDDFFDEVDDNGLFPAAGLNQEASDRTRSVRRAAADFLLKDTSSRSTASRTIPISSPPPEQQQQQQQQQQRMRDRSRSSSSRVRDKSSSGQDMKDASERVKETSSSSPSEPAPSSMKDSSHRTPASRDRATKSSSSSSSSRTSRASRIASGGKNKAPRSKSQTRSNKPRRTATYPANEPRSQSIKHTHQL